MPALYCTVLHCTGGVKEEKMRGEGEEEEKVSLLTHTTARGVGKKSI